MKKELMLSVKPVLVFIKVLLLMFVCSLFMCVNMDTVEKGKNGLVTKDYDFSDNELETDDEDNDNQDQNGLISLKVLCKKIERDECAAKNIKDKERLKKLTAAMRVLQKKFDSKKIDELEKDLKKKQKEFDGESPKEEGSFVWNEICGFCGFCYGLTTGFMKKTFTSLFNGGSDSIATVAYYGSRLGVFTLVMLLIHYNEWDRKFIKWVINYLLNMSFGIFGYIGQGLQEAVMNKVPGAKFVATMYCYCAPTADFCLSMFK
jgi:hypothetical protein